MSWGLYLILTVDGYIYCGIAKDIKKRFIAHQKGVGSKFLRAHPPLKLYRIEEFDSRGDAQKREHEIKSLTRMEKLTLMHSFLAEEVSV